MPETQISCPGINPLGSLALDVTGLRAEGTAVYPQLIVPLRLAITTDVVAAARAKLRVWTASASLFFNGALLSDRQGDVIDQHCYANNSGQDLRLRFPLDLARVEHIERHRTDDVPFTIRGSLAFDATRDQNPTASQASPPRSTAFGLVGLFAVSFSLEFVVPRSHWTHTVLPRLGWSAIRIVELPVPVTPAWKETFATAFSELEEAQRLFRDGNFDQAVAHCRAAIEPFRKQVQDLKVVLKEGRDSKDVAAREFSLLHSMASGTADWLTSQIEKLHTLSSAAHHAPAVGHFSRDQAHALLLLTTSIVMYAGQALSNQER